MRWLPDSTAPFPFGLFVLFPRLVEHHPAAEREARLRARHCLERVRDQFSPVEFTAIYQRGQQLDLDQVIGYLLTDLLTGQRE